MEHVYSVLAMEPVQFVMGMQSKVAALPIQLVLYVQPIINAHTVAGTAAVLFVEPIINAHTVAGTPTVLILVVGALRTIHLVVVVPIIIK